MIFLPFVKKYIEDKHFNRIEELSTILNVDATFIESVGFGFYSVKQAHFQKDIFFYLDINFLLNHYISRVPFYLNILKKNFDLRRNEIVRAIDFLESRYYYSKYFISNSEISRYSRDSNKFLRPIALYNNIYDI